MWQRGFCRCDEVKVLEMGDGLLSLITLGEQNSCLWSEEAVTREERSKERCNVIDVQGEETKTVFQWACWKRAIFPAREQKGTDFPVETPERKGHCFWLSETLIDLLTCET